LVKLLSTSAISSLNALYHKRNNTFQLNMLGVALVPFSQCSLRENPKFLKKFRSKNITLEEKF
jgi:hypothetical protein